MSSVLCPAALGSDLIDIHASVPARTTFFAPAGRDTPAEIDRKASIIARVPLLSRALDAMPGMVMILNSNRQIVVANRKLIEVLGTNVAEIIEKRPGEAIKCIRAKEGPDGCGTGVHCSTCGAVNAILDCGTHNAEAVRECRILVQTPSGVVPLDLRVTASPFEAENEYLILAAIEDISQEKRVAVLQRTFFHDVLNTAGCLHGYADYLASDTASDPEICQRLTALSSQLIEEIQAQRDLLHAESGDLKTQPVPVKASQVLEELRSQYLKHPVAAGREISIGQTWPGPIITDRRLLQRVLGNMVKNALEATFSGSHRHSLLYRQWRDCDLYGQQPGGHAHGRPTSSLPTVLQYERASGPRDWNLQHEALWGTVLGRPVDFVSRSSEGTTFRLGLPKKPLV